MSTKTGRVEPVIGLGDDVLVKTTNMIDGQHEHAAIITKVHHQDLVNVLLMPSAGDAYPISLVPSARAAPRAPIRFRLRPRS